MTICRVLDAELSPSPLSSAERACAAGSDAAAVGGECSAARPTSDGTESRFSHEPENVRGQVVDPAADPFFVKCRCGRRHQVREHDVPCKFCGGPTFDAHAVCGRCRAREGAS